MQCFKINIKLFITSKYAFYKFKPYDFSLMTEHIDAWWSCYFFIKQSEYFRIRDVRIE